MPDAFNDYDEQGFRVTSTGNRSSRTEDNAIIRNLRFAFKQSIAHLSDTRLVNLYDEFALSDWFGDNDARFLEFIEGEE